MSNNCLKANKKLSVLLRLKDILTFQQQKMLFNSFLEGQFKHCSLV